MSTTLEPDITTSQTEANSSIWSSPCQYPHNTTTWNISCQASDFVALWNGSCRCPEEEEGEETSVEKVPFLRTFIASIISVLIVVNNIVNLIILRRMTSINVRVKALMASMSVSDLLLGLFVCVPGIFAALIHFWPFSSAFCQITGMINGMSISVSMWSLTGITVERFLVVVQPIYFHHRPRLHHIRLGIAFIWIFNVLYYLLPVFLSEDMVYYVYQPDMLVCGFVWEPDWVLYLSAALYPIGPGLIIVVCSSQIIRAIRRSNLQVMDVSYAVSSSSMMTPSDVQSSVHALADLPNETGVRMARLEVPAISGIRVKMDTRDRQLRDPSYNYNMRNYGMKREAKVSKVMIITAAAFFSCSFPYLCTAIAEKQLAPISSWHSFGVMWLLNCNSFINVFIYSAIYAEFRQLFKVFFIPHCLAS